MPQDAAHIKDQDQATQSQDTQDQATQSQDTQDQGPDPSKPQESGAGQGNENAVSVFSQETAEFDLGDIDTPGDPQQPNTPGGDASATSPDEGDAPTGAEPKPENKTAPDAISEEERKVLEAYRSGNTAAIRAALVGEDVGGRFLAKNAAGVHEVSDAEVYLQALRHQGNNEATIEQVQEHLDKHYPKDSRELNVGYGRMMNDLRSQVARTESEKAEAQAMELGIVPPKAASGEEANAQEQLIEVQSAINNYTKSVREAVRSSSKRIGMLTHDEDTSLRKGLLKTINDRGIRLETFFGKDDSPEELDPEKLLQAFATLSPYAGEEGKKVRAGLAERAQQRVKYMFLNGGTNRPQPHAPASSGSGSGKPHVTGERNPDGSLKIRT